MISPEIVYVGLNLSVLAVIYLLRRQALIRLEHATFVKIKLQYLKLVDEAQVAWDAVIQKGIEDDFFGAVELVKIANKAKERRANAYADMALFVANAKYVGKPTVRWVLEKEIENNQNQLSFGVTTTLIEEIDKLHRKTGMTEQLTNCLDILAGVGDKSVLLEAIKR